MPKRDGHLASFQAQFESTKSSSRRFSRASCFSKSSTARLDHFASRAAAQRSYLSQLCGKEEAAEWWNANGVRTTEMCSGGETVADFT